MEILGKNHDILITEAQKCFKLLATEANINNGNRHCGILTIRIPDDGYNRIVKPIGSVDGCTEEELNRWSINSQEKAERLEKNLEIGHISSEQSRDLDNKKYRGSIIAGRIIFAFSSSLAEYDDEAFCLMLAYRLILIEWVQLEKIIKISNNPRLEFIRKNVVFRG